MLKEMMFNKRPYVLLEKMLDKSALSQRVISSNVANVSTPGYERLGVSFDEVLKQAVKMDRMNLKRTDPRHMPDPNWVRNIKPNVEKVENGYWNGINNVNIDQEMVDLAKVQLDFNMGSKLLNNRFNQLRMCIRGRR
jgi:flagellar basal-body rod protein FlgB